MPPCRNCVVWLAPSDYKPPQYPSPRGSCILLLVFPDWVDSLPCSCSGFLQAYLFSIPLQEWLAGKKGPAIDGQDLLIAQHTILSKPILDGMSHSYASVHNDLIASSKCC
eukprot:522119-Amphidinium_carterae.2